VLLNPKKKSGSTITSLRASAIQSDDQLLAVVCGSEEVATNDQMLARQLAGVTQPEGKEC